MRVIDLNSTQLKDDLAKELGYDSFNQWKEHVRYLRRLSPSIFMTPEDRKKREDITNKSTSNVYKDY